MSTEDARNRLKEISTAVKPLVKGGEFPNVNTAIIEISYKDETHQEFQKFSQWKKKGFKIIKGSKGFPVWGKPIEAQKLKEGGEVNEYEYFPICYLFSNAQVEPMKEAA